MNSPDICVIVVPFRSFSLDVARSLHYLVAVLTEPLRKCLEVLVRGHLRALYVVNLFTILGLLISCILVGYFFFFGYHRTAGIH